MRVTSGGGSPTSTRRKGFALIKLTKFPGVLLCISGPRGHAPATPMPGHHATTVEFLTFKVRGLTASMAKRHGGGGTFDGALGRAHERRR